MEMIKVTLEKAKSLGLNQDNHISSASKEDFKTIYELDLVKSLAGPAKGEEYTITSWYEPGKETDIVIYKVGDNKFFWEPNVERLYRLETIKTYKPTEYMFGYIDGRKSHLGEFTKGMVSANLNVGYLFWHEFK